MVLDTNALFLPITTSMRLEDAAERLLGPVRFVVPTSVTGEWRGLADRAVPARAASALADGFEQVTTEKRGDAGVAEVAHRLGAWVITADRASGTGCGPTGSRCSRRGARAGSWPSRRSARKRLRTVDRSHRPGRDVDGAMTDADLLLDTPNPEYGSGVIGVCDICGKRQAVIVLAKERYKLCVIDFLNKSWNGSNATPGAPLPPYRSEQVWFPTSVTRDERAPAILLEPTRVVRHPVLLMTPEVHGLTTAILDGAIRFAREGFEVLLPDVDRAGLVGPRDHLSLRMGARGGGVLTSSPVVRRLTELYGDALEYLRRSGPMADPEKAAVVGLSYGGSLALSLAAREQKLSALALAYPVPVRPPETVRLVNAPTFLVLGRRDPVARRAPGAARAGTLRRSPQGLRGRRLRPQLPEPRPPRVSALGVRGRLEGDDRVPQGPDVPPSPEAPAASRRSQSRDPFGARPRPASLEPRGAGTDPRLHSLTGPTTGGSLRPSRGSRMGTGVHE